jgi:putative hydrolase of the HAD superfamily
MAELWTEEVLNAPCERSCISRAVLIDGDDTLWPESVYFDEAVSALMSAVGERGWHPELTRRMLVSVQQEFATQHGYGVPAFKAAVLETLRRVGGEALCAVLSETAVALADAVERHAIDPLPGVPDALEYLASKHRMILLTKGPVLQQETKVQKSGLRKYFSSVEIVTEKNVATYRKLVSRYGLDKGATWMIGNSPQSDINPALAAGMNAIFVPNDHTWLLERDTLTEPRPPSRLLTITQFSEILTLL